MTAIIRQLYIWFYALKIWQVLGILLAVFLVWVFLTIRLKGSHKSLLRVLSAGLLFVSLAVISYVVLKRNVQIREVHLQPFYKITMAQKNIEAYREALMNAILFVPIGLTVPHILPPAWKNGKRFLMTVLIALTFSAVLEISQYLFSLGTSETDDVICNTVGTALGALHFLLAHFLCRSAEKKHI